MYCLGNCFAAPAPSRDFPRSKMSILSREPIVFGPISSLDASFSKDGHHALDEALGRLHTKPLSASELSGLRGHLDAGFQTENKYPFQLSMSIHGCDPHHCAVSYRLRLCS